ncbi:hypothetical protein BST65_01575 [Bradyrhizobium canariense]|nr:hypothetical protein BST65_01575 [Bradyrhizobium canariense]OSI38624.1 hypothetical protein BST66_02185 [Bradyrhizobium canariense]OSI55276.1 hypothetical protein BSZ20_01865 [Bradyrhizobium canariense]OSI56962.1 hypothetical protein BST67_02555 [Bradyrhizobium canariense]OSI59776.1 hypothetical protein BSZ15_03065 [Bradyrhizobium canariense]
MDQIHAGQTATMRWPAFNQKTTAEIDEKFGLVSADISGAVCWHLLLYRSRHPKAEGAGETWVGQAFV